MIFCVYFWYCTWHKCKFFPIAPKQQRTSIWCLVSFKHKQQDRCSCVPSCVQFSVFPAYLFTYVQDISYCSISLCTVRFQVFFVLSSFFSSSTLQGFGGFTCSGPMSRYLAGVFQCIFSNEVCNYRPTSERWFHSFIVKGFSHLFLPHPYQSSVVHVVLVRFNLLEALYARPVLLFFPLYPPYCPSSKNLALVSSLTV